MASPSKLPVVLYPGEDGSVVATCPLIPGCISEGEDRAAALRNIREAIALCLENQASEGWRLPTGYELFDVAVSG